jgi:dethiobiotin synthetase
MRIVVVGTGTEVGKTHVACALLHALAARKEEAIGLKPVQTGVDGSRGDACRLGSVGMPAVAPRYAFAEPVSPHLAARRAGTEIAIEEIVRWVAAYPLPWQVVETAGGLLSPLAPGCSNLDLVLALAPHGVVLVGADRLGVLHDVSAALHVLTGVEIRPVVCLSAPATSDASTGTNAAELAELRIANAVVFPRAAADERASLAAATEVLDRLER